MEHPPAEQQGDLQERVRRLRAQRQQQVGGTTASTAPPKETKSQSLPKEEPRIVLAVDYGTTFTGVAYTRVTGRDELDSQEIYVVQRWDGKEEVKVPSEISYSKTPKHLQQYGFDIDVESDVLARTKLELQESDDRLKELKTFNQTLFGLAKLRLDDEHDINHEIPTHLYKNAEDIIEDYLDKVAEVVYADISTTLGKYVLDQIPVDMIITHPAKWDVSALNKTYRAVAAAFSQEKFPKMRNVSFVSEPEACAHFTLRAAQRQDHDRLRKGDCFIVVDAGGGTVDLAAFRIIDMNVERTKFRMTSVGSITGFACGATFVDQSFNDLLKRRLDQEDCDQLLDNGRFGEGGHYVLKPDAAHMQRAFIPIKHTFDDNDGALVDPIQLPRSIANKDNPAKGIEGGALTLSRADLQGIFKYSVDKTLALIARQIRVIQTGKLKVKNVFLSGGYANSPYLFARVKQYCGELGIGVEKGENCWSAVAQGAVMKGLGLLTDKPSIITRCPKHFGIKSRTKFSEWQNSEQEREEDVEGVQWATDQIKWFVAKGDAIVPEAETVRIYDVNFTTKASEYPQPPKGKKSKVPVGPTSLIREIVFVASEADDPPVRFADHRRPREQVVPLQIDLLRVPEHYYETRESDRKGVGKYMSFKVRVTIRVSITDVVVTVTSGGVELTPSWSGRLFPAPPPAPATSVPPRGQEPPAFEPPAFEPLEPGLRREPTVRMVDGVGGGRSAST